MPRARARFAVGHAAWLAMACSILIWWRGELRAGELGNTGNWYRIVLVLFAAAMCAVGLLKNAGRLSRGFSGPLIFLLAYGVIGMVSALYIPRYSLYSMWKASEFIIDVLAIGVVLSGPQPQASARIAYRIILGLFATLVFVYWVEALVLPADAFVRSRGLIPFTLQGVLPIMNGNAVAFISAVVAFAAWCRLLARRGAAKAGWLVVAVLAFSLLILAQSRTSLIGFVLAVAVQLFFARRFALLGLLALAAVLVAASADIVSVTERYLVRGQSKELFDSLSGRTLAWRAAWLAFEQSPVLGYGFAAAARADILGTTGASTLHGAVFDVLVGVGLLGFIPWAVAIGWTSLRLARLGIAVRSTHNDNGADRSAIAEMLGVLTLIIVRSTTSSGLALHEHEFMVFLAVLGFVTTAASGRHTGALASGADALRRVTAHRATKQASAASAVRPAMPSGKRTGRMARVAATVPTSMPPMRARCLVRLVLFGVCFIVAAGTSRANETNIAPFCTITSTPYMGASIAYLTDGKLASPADGTLMRAAPLGPRIGVTSLRYLLALPGRYGVKRIRLFQSASSDRRAASEYLIEADTAGNGGYDRVLASETHGSGGRWFSYVVSPPVSAYAIRFRTLDSVADIGANFGPPAIEEFEIFTDDQPPSALPRSLPDVPRLDVGRAVDMQAAAASAATRSDQSAFRRGLFGSTWLWWAPGQPYSEAHNEAVVGLLRRLGVNRYWLYPGVYVHAGRNSPDFTFPHDPDYLRFVERQLATAAGSGEGQVRVLPFPSDVVPGFRQNILGRLVAQMHDSGVRVVADELLLPYGLESWDFPRIVDTRIYPSVRSSPFVRDASTKLYEEFMHAGVDGLALGGDEFFLNEGDAADEDRSPVCRDAHGATRGICKPTTLDLFRQRFGRDVDPFQGRFSSAKGKWKVFGYEQLATLFAHHAAMMKSIDADAIVTSLFRPGQENRWRYGTAYDVMGWQGGVEEMSSDPYWSHNSALGHYYFAGEVKKLSGASRSRTAVVTLQASPTFDVNGYRDPLLVYGAAFSALMHGASGINFYKQDYLFAGGANDAGPWVEKFFALTKLLDAEGLARYRIPKGIAVLYSRASEDWWELAHAGDPEQAWQATVYQNGVMEVLFRNGMPFDLYYLDQPESLGEIGDYRVLILPYPYSVSKPALDAIRAAIARGTRVMAISRFGEVDEFGAVRETPLLRDVPGIEHVALDLASSRYDDVSQRLSQRLRAVLGSANPLTFDAAGRDVECSIMEKDDDRLLFCLNWENQALDVELGMNLHDGGYEASVVTLDRESVATIGGKSVLAASDLARFRLALAPEAAEVIIVRRVAATTRPSR
jgi:O-antigen ligase